MRQSQQISRRATFSACREGFSLIDIVSLYEGLLPQLVSENIKSCASLANSLAVKKEVALTKAFAACGEGGAPRILIKLTHLSDKA